MTREERRKAVEELLGSTQKVVDIESSRADETRNCNAGCNCDKIDSTIDDSQPLPADTSFACSDEGPVCSICLVEYEPTDLVFKSKSCPHMFHGDCLFSWLERRNNTVSKLKNRFLCRDLAGCISDKRILFTNCFRRNVLFAERIWYPMRIYGMLCNE